MWRGNPTSGVRVFADSGNIFKGLGVRVGEEIG